MNFGALNHIDMVETLGKFEMRRYMTATGIFRTVMPLTV
jgi:hypothetical protein